MRKALSISLAAIGLGSVGTPALADHHMAEDKTATSDLADPAAFEAQYAEALSGALNHPSRAEDRARDQYRHPSETLSFFRVEPDMKVGEYAPGGGWYTRVLGHYLGGEGQLVGLFFDPMAGPFDAEAQEGFRQAAANFPAQAAEFTGLPADRFSGMTLETITDEEAGTFDRVLVIRMMHNLMRANIADNELKKMRMLLKPGGLLGIVQHRAPADATSEYANGTKGYLRQDDVVSFVESMGFELVGSSEINANPNDTADHEQGVWEMPPVLRTDRDDLRNLGESDRMTLLFRKRP
ncbi:methyltransferase [Altererythrobacter aurantiacus]|uniref:Methyltransferase n=1 Tax=Parapontixanthobacter aurantiacus TaxID=1463599 RepID=A0A844ZLB5_9SPHN|nr:class I SAM-dependent methyltransferase [Parapontixanthobacter aurantiacus]MXO86469.1 methyltransferase [Parapontixanthobacter aurantiacus]